MAACRNGGNKGVVGMAACRNGANLPSGSSPALSVFDVDLRGCHLLPWVKDRNCGKQEKSLQRRKGVSEKITAGRLYDCQSELFIGQLAGET